MEPEAPVDEPVTGSDDDTDGTEGDVTTPPETPPVIPTPEPEPPIADPEVPPTPAEPAPLMVAANSEAVGTDGPDLFELPEALDRKLENVTIRAGGGDDLLQLSSQEYDAPEKVMAPLGLGSSEVFAGAGDDTITASGYNLDIYGDDGDDVVNAAFAPFSRLHGGDGDDSIGGASRGSDALFLYGDNGDDMIDGRGFDNALFSGGDGDDTIYLSGGSQDGAGYTLRTDGGSGDDLIEYDGTAVKEGFSAGIVEGGDGADIFRARFTEGEITNLEDVLAEEIMSREVIRIPDFDPQEDVIEIDARTASETATLVEARLEEDADAGVTELTMRYEDTDGPDQDVTVFIETLGLDWGDIDFIGDTTPTLKPVTPAI